MTQRPDRFPSDYAERRFVEPALLAPRRDPAGIHYDGVEYARVEGFRPLELDLSVPVGAGAKPVVVWIHGGAWWGGSHRLYADDIIDVIPLREQLLGAGIAFASIAYRHSSEAVFPAQLHDVWAALRYLRRFAGELGLDGARVGVAGESAGAHLALLAARPDSVDTGIDEGVAGIDSAVSAVVSWYGPTDITGIADADSPAGALLGGAPNALPALARAASPVHQVTAASAPALLIHGDADALVDLSHSEKLRDAYRAAGASVELVVVPGADHCFLGTDPAPQIARTAAFFAARLAQPNVNE